VCVCLLLLFESTAGWGKEQGKEGESVQVGSASHPHREHHDFLLPEIPLPSSLRNPPEPKVPNPLNQVSESHSFLRFVISPLFAPPVRLFTVNDLNSRSQVTASPSSKKDDSIEASRMLTNAAHFHGPNIFY
jgi:hypothetical protein